MTLMQQIKDQYGPKVREAVEKLDNNWEYPKEQREEVRKFLRELPKKYGSKKQ